MSGREQDVVGVPPVAELPGPSAEDWDALAAEAGNIFLTHAWAQCWWRHYGQNARPHVVPVPGSGAFMALSSTGRMLRQARLLGAGPADQLGILGSASQVPSALRELRTFLGGRPRHDLFVANDVPVSEAWAEQLGGTVLRFEPSPVVTLSYDTWDEFLAARSRNFREQARRKERRLHRDFRVVLRLADEETFDRDMATLFTLHQQRWGTDAGFASGRERRFQIEFAAVALAAGRLRLWVLELDGEPVASLHGFRFAGAEYFHQGGRNPAFDAHSVGFLLLAHAIRAALEDGMGEYRLLRGGEPYKARFADAQADVCTVAVPLTARGRLAVTAAARRRA
ncbi:GNAT family N-acetyltransferase [Blastococcus saxobsidens]|uniref:GNAT family N-acetyltransferase n=1 Tax=Blastococcus saxobsidens TaxID=138336 RepID=A0A6L9VYD6_9ACTN|nr:GNAT family N-acetyltransferase [Blastococcus saxobsidens]NEK84291.1 GNAT family N-acetyltransferase [Blastococcus saxobsidens]